MAQPTPSRHPLRRLFRRVVQRAFASFRDLYAPGVAAHICENVLGGFVHSEHLYRLRDARGLPVENLSKMVQVAHRKEGPERRVEVDGYIGDFVLFMGGFFPSALRRQHWIDAEPLVAKVGNLLVPCARPYDYYVAEGRNAYARAARAGL